MSLPNLQNPALKHYLYTVYCCAYVHTPIPSLLTVVYVSLFHKRAIALIYSSQNLPTRPTLCAIYEAHPSFLGIMTNIVAH